ncbi:hypothetical protein F5148DRAFT_1161452 [Russula earlei]|uniref:Uncharacterized protein n=1 Tax=Russula earlei TaxID=71964 RepID=A0ACC0UM38_9AGAM|nr:hypothetical protein F5148DRAFT_1161452 [Russula earlei]
MKKRKHNPGSLRHWDEPEQLASSLPYDEDEVDKAIQENAAVINVDKVEEEAEEAEEAEEESRELTYDEIWDDSALIAAWESATAEYEAYHGKAKDWKKEPAKRSPLWYNVPPGPSDVTRESGATQPDPENSRPLDYNTFVPSHDPTLEAYGIPPAAVSRDEAFSRAMNAMYWAGYWTAIYHSHGHINKEGIAQDTKANGYHEKQSAGGPDEDDESLISTQR